MGGGLYNISIVELRKTDHFCIGTSTQNRRVEQDTPTEKWASLKDSKQSEEDPQVHAVNAFWAQDTVKHAQNFNLKQRTL